MVPNVLLPLLRRARFFALSLLLVPGYLFAQPTGNVIVATSTTWATGTYNMTSLTVQNGAVLTIGGGSTLTVSGAILVTGSSSIVLQSANNSAQVNGVWAGAGIPVVAASVEVDAGSSINADGQGYVANAGPGGTPASDGGGSYGGVGGYGVGQAGLPTYGSASTPTDLGSGGGSRCCSSVPGQGGGAVLLTVTGTLTNNGVISANGGNISGYQASGGSGGSVYVRTGVLTGSGTFDANGGLGGEAGGGGGRIAVYYNGSASNFTGFAASTASGGGCGNQCSNGTASAGSVGTAAFFDTSSSNSNLMVDQNFTIPASSSVSYNSITVLAGATLTIGGGTTVTVANGLTVSGTVIVQSINNSAQVNNLWAGAGSTIKAAFITVNTGGSLNADGQGYVANAGPGGAPGGSDAGGSYGGLGGYSLGAYAVGTYGSITNPTDLGSGGGSRCCSSVPGNGGGAITLVVSGTITNNGVISANGAAISGYQSSGGSGGSLNVTTAGLAGSGAFEANGGLGGEAGGGGGRVVVYYNATSSSFTGYKASTVSAGGCGTQCNDPNLSLGGNGTAAFFDTSATNNNVSVYQNYVVPASTTVSYNSLSVQAGALLTVGGGSTVNVATALNVSGTVVAQAINNAAQVNGAWVGTGVGINAATVTVSSTGSINADYQGYVANAGPGGSPVNSSAGGSYGGIGGVGNGVAPNATYGSPTAPVDLGSGGGSRCCSTNPGQGGGALTFTVTGTLTDNGIISANGFSGTGLQVGGSAGGTVAIHTGTLAGTGTIAVNGGQGGEAGGGGGRAAIYYNALSGFNLDLITANGGTSSNGNAGAPGTVYTLAMGSNLTVSDNTTLPANANLTYSSVTINNSATLTLGAGTTLTTGSLNIGNTSTFVVGGGSTLNVSGAMVVTGNSNVILQSINNSAQVNNAWVGSGVALNAGSLEVDAGSTINADGQGYTQNAGPGTTPGGDDGGASYGGVGGTGNGTPGAAVYGSTTAPMDLGSGGGSRCCSSVPGNGGGAMHLTVTGTLSNNGIISANGQGISGYQSSGGAGGSVYVQTGALIGAGIFEANGGLGGEAGGGGGRVAVYYNGTSSNFTGFAGSTTTGGGCGNQCSNGTASAGNVGTVGFFDTSATNNNLSVYQNFVIPASTSYNSVNVQPNAVVTVAGGTTIGIANTLTVGGTLIAQSINNAAQVNGVWAGQGVSINAASVTVASTGSINADGQGYQANDGPGGAAGGSSAGGSYGGLGGNGDGQAPTATYGSPTMPVDLGSGGGSRCCSTIPGQGGGAILFNISGTLTDNGIISANGAVAQGSQVGGSAGGSIAIHTGTLAGTGTIAVNGGPGGEAGGSGGRAAVYYNTNSGFALTQITSNGGAASGGNAGAMGTVYLLGAGTNLTVVQNTVLPSNTNVTYSTVAVSNAGTFSIGSNSTMTAGSINVAGAGTFTVGGGSTVTDTGALVVTGNSNVIAQGLNNAGPVNGTYAGTGVTFVANSVQVDAGSSINADSQGYQVGVGPGAAPGGSSDGGSYGGLGGESNGVVPGPTYGSATSPMALGSGGSSRCCSAPAGAGGGAIRMIVSGTITDNGIISANGGASSNQAGGGSGGSIFIVTSMLSGTGAVQANGGAGGEGSGGGGRVALYYLTSTGFNPASVTAVAGSVVNSGGASGAAGTVNLVNGPTSVFLLPTAPVIHGTSATVQWFTDIGGPSTVSLAGPQTGVVATGSTGLTTATFDTTQFPDGAYQLVLTVLNSSGQLAQTVTQDVVINNSVAWHSGTLTSSQTWQGPQVQALDGAVIVPAGVTLTILPGTIVKALPGSSIIVQNGGTLIADGTSTSQIVFTTFDDYTVGGNTDFNQGITVPSPGEWNGIAALTGGTFNDNANTVIRYVATTLSGSLSGSITLYSTQVVSIAGTLVVPSGVTMTIQPGAIIKMQAGAGIDVQPGATLIANGTLAQPIYFTSYNDISIGGDTNNTGGAVAPQPGDWNSIILDGTTASLQHVQMQYGGGPVNSGSQAGMLETTDNATVTISSSIFAYSYTIGIQTGYPNGGGDTVTVTDSVFYGNEDRAINAYPGSTVHVVNDTFDANAYGPFAHGGVMDVENSVVSNSIGTQFGSVEVCCGSTFANYSNNDVYTTAKGVTNYVGLTDPTGTAGNISAPPVYMNQALHDYHPTYGSPLIDAANGTVPNYPLTDAFGVARYNAPLVTKKTGTPDVNGNYPDIGAFEFVQSAPSNLDLTVSNVQGPTSTIAGNQVTVTWTVTNIGTGTAYGPWHDAVYLVSDPNTNPVLSLGGTFLEGSGIVLGPGASYNATATVTVPGTTVGEQRWEVKTNVLGEVFEGANTANNTGIAINPVFVDLNQLLPGAAPTSGVFSGSGQSAYYKVIPSATQTTKVQLGLNSGYAGSVQLFVGAGYVPSPQRYDIQQVEYNSSSASVVIPSGSDQIYYVTAYAQTLPVAPSPFTIQASNVSFSLTSVTPGNVVNSGNATLTFVGGGFTPTTTFLLKAANGTTYSSSAVFIADSGHADVTFAVGTIPAGTYSAEAILGSTITLSNAVTLSTGVAAIGTNPSVQVTLDTPEAFRAGFPSVITLHYTNITTDDIVAPLIYVSAANATLSAIAPPCSTCSANYQQQYGATFSSGLVLGINQQGPAGVLPSGASGSIQFLATPGASGTASFYASPDGVDPIATQLTLAQNLCYQTTGIVEVVCYYNQSPVGAYQTAASFCAGLSPTGVPIEGEERACMALLNNAGYSYQNLQLQGGDLGLQSYWNQFDYGHVTAANFNAVLAADATALSSSGIYTYDIPTLLGYELQKDGLAQLTNRYHQGAFGFGNSHPYDVKLASNVVLYPNGTTRIFTTPSTTQANTFLGAVGDLGTLALQSDGSYLLTESSGTVVHFLATTGLLDYVQDRDGNYVKATYTNGLVSSVTDNFGYTSSFTYDSLGHVTQFTDGSGRSTTFTYDILKDAQNSTFLRSYTNANGTTNLTWNEGGSAGVGYFDDSCITTYCQPAIGITNITYPDGSQANYTYDAVGRVASVTGNSGAQAVYFAYNNDGSVSITDALGKVSRITPTQGNSIGAFTDPLGNLTKVRYNGENKPINIVGPLGDSSFATYDSLGNLNSITTAKGSLDSVSYTADEALTALTDPNGNTSTFGYDSAYDFISQSFPNGSTFALTANSQGLPLTFTNRRGKTITYTWNPQGLMATKTFSNGQQFTYTYDGHQNLTSVSAPIGTTRFTWNAADRITSQTNPDGTSLTYTYNANGQRASMTDSTGFVTNYTYDALGRLAGLTDGSGASIVTYTYDAAGQLVTKTLGNGTSASVTRDSDGNVTSLINYSASKAVLSEYDYTFDGDGHPLSMKAPSGFYSYTYDLDGQLTSVTTPTGLIQYTYDAAGNRTSVTTNGVSATYEPNNLNEYQVANNVAYTYDADGNVLTGNGYTYTYDDEGKLLTMVSATDNWSFQYDGLNERVVSVHNGTTVHYLIDPLSYGYVAAEFNGTGSLLAHYVVGLDLTSTVPAGGSADYYHFDGTGNTGQITNSAGTVVNSYLYLPFGEQTVLSSGITNPFTYNAQVGVQDDGSGLYFMRSRTYDSTIGRFHEPDPFGYTRDVNLYRYAANSPVQYFDPSGGDQAQAFIDATTDSAPVHAFNIAAPSVQTALSAAKDSPLAQNTSNALGVVGLTSTSISLGNNINQGNVLGSIHDTALLASSFIDTALNDAPKTPYTVALQFVAHNASTIDEASYNIFNEYFQDQQELNPDNPFTRPPPACGTCLTHKRPPTMDPINTPIDPNGKLTSGYGNNGYVPAGAPITYTVYFENQPTATLSAQIVTVTDPLPSNLDWSTVQFNNISFNNVSLTTPTNTQTYKTQANVSTDSNPVSVSAAVNPGTGVLTVVMQSVDPVTGGSPANPLSGFLPPNNAANAGVGSVTFTVTPKTGLTNGAVINNQASIVFDVNAAIATNTVTNTLDTSTVTSSINPLPSSTTSPNIAVSWTGSDTSGSGISSYNIYVSEDGAAYTLWLSASTATSATYTAVTGHTYTFYSIATNNVGIVQSAPVNPQTIAVNQGVPAVTVTPASSSIGTAQSLGVMVTVASPNSGGAVPTGSVTLSSGTYTSSAVTLASGSASFTIAAGALATGVDTLTATYLPDTASTTLYTGATGTAQVSVGVVTPVPGASLSPAAGLTFTSVSGTASAAQTMQLTNTGTATLTISGVTITGAGAAAFADTSACGNSLAAGFSCNISVTFTPPGATGYTATLTVTDNAASGTTQSVSLTGTGTAVPAPIASLNVTSLSFTSVNGTASAVQTAKLSNTGNAALTISGITITGTGASTFAQTNTCGTSVAAGANCIISITFTPSSATSFSAAVSIADNATGSPQTVALTGTGTAVPAPVASLNVTSLSFSSVNGTPSAVQTAQLSNTGTAALAISGISLTGTGASTFAQTNTCGTSVAAGSNCLISITFTPSSVTTFGATLSIADNATGSPQTVTLSGTGTAAAAPAASLNTTSLTFTSTSGTTSAVQTAQLSNTGTAALTISGITVTGTGASTFAETNTCGTSLAAGANCLISITFTPSSATTFTAAVAIADNATGSPQGIALTGTGTAVLTPGASLSVSSLSFTSLVGTPSAVQISKLTNTGTGALTISGITVTGTGAADFAQTNTCGTSLAAGSSCLISVTFTPVAAAAYTAAVSIADNATGSPQSIALTGTGTALPAPIASVTPATLTFTSVSGIASAVQTSQLSNTGNAALTISGITITGSGAGSFAQTNTCGTSLAAGANCTISVTFTPSSVTSFSAAVSIADNAGGSPQTVTLTGTGTAPPTFTLSASPSTQTIVPGSSTSYTITVTPQNGAFTTAVGLSISGLPPGATTTFAPASVTPGSSAVNSTLTILTPASLAELRPLETGSPTRPLLALAGLVFLVTARKRRQLRLLIMLLIVSLAGLGALTGCGSAPKSQTYNMTVTGTAGTVVQTTAITLVLHE